MKRYFNRLLLILIVLILAIPSLIVRDIVSAQGVIDGVEDTSAVDESKAVTLKDKVSGLKMKVPNNLNIEGYKNDNAKGFIIDWSKSIILAPGEIMTVSVWNRDTKKEMNKAYKQIIEMDKCPNYDPATVCMINFPTKPREMSVYSKYFRFDKSLIRVTYSFSHLYEVDSFKAIANSILVNGDKQFKKSDYKILKDNKQTRDPTQIRGATSCGGFTDSNNPYDCCYSSNADQNDANCTWYAAYKRPDLKGIITLWPEGLFNQAVQAGVPTSYNQPVPGALMVWQLHVAYVESVGDNSVTWSEQNCFKPSNPFNASVTRSSFTPNYAAGNFLGYILPPGGVSINCNGTNVRMSDWNYSGTLSCSPVSSLTIAPESNLSGNISIIPR